jgi:hypothetical protein
MHFTLSVALLSAAIAASSNLAAFVPGQQDAPLGSKWGSLPIPSKVTYKAPEGSTLDPSACSLNVTVVTVSDVRHQISPLPLLMSFHSRRPSALEDHTDGDRFSRPTTSTAKARGLSNPATRATMVTCTARPTL